MVAVVNSNIFGGGPYSTKGGRQLREVGKTQRTLSEIKIKPRSNRHGRKIGKVWRPGIVESYMPEKITDDFHPGGNSICYMIQMAHLMGCDPIYLLAFTLESGSPYHFGKMNPVTRRGSFYDSEPSMLWLNWYQSRYPGRVKVCSGWSGPVYDVFELERFHAEEAQGKSSERHESEAHGGDDDGAERLRHARSGQSLHEDGKQSGEAGSMREEGQEEWWG